MELRHLEYFVAVAEELSFTRAAERLSIAQSPVSQQIRKLERELGTPLFDRTTRSVELTDAGRSLYGDAVAMLEASRRAADNARLAGHGKVGRLTLAFTGSATYELMPLLVSAYAQRFPEVSLEIRSEMLTPEQVDGILDDSVSVGLLRPPVNAEGLVVEVVRQEPLVVLLPVAHRLASRVSIGLAELRDELFIGYPSSPPSSVHRAMLAACRQAGFVPTIRQEVAETSSLVAMVAAGLGVAIAPSSVRHLRIDGVTHRQLDAAADLSVPLALAYRAGRVSPLLRGYLETARSVLQVRKAPLPGPSFEPDEADRPESI